MVSKFEDPNLIHFLKSPSGALNLSFPRFALEFEADEKGTFHSKNYLGYRLKQCQQLEDGLRDFTKYLLLEATDGREKMLLPQGEVIQVREKGNVSILVPGNCDNRKQVL